MTWMSSKLLLPQEPYASIQRAVVRAKETDKARRVDVVINHSWVLPVHDVVHANARRPPIAAKTELTLHCGIYREEIRESELPGAGNNLPELVDRDKAKPGTPYARPGHVKFLELPGHWVTAPCHHLVWGIPRQRAAHLVSHQQRVNGKVHGLVGSCARARIRNHRGISALQ